MQHTPGPWRFIPSDDARRPDRITNPSGSNIVTGNIGFHPDAQLIANAPQMLAVLHSIVDMLRDPNDMRADVLALARDTIARATGTAPAAPLDNWWPDDDVVHFYDSHPDVTLGQLARVSGRTVPELKALLMGKNHA